MQEPISSNAVATCAAMVWTVGYRVDKAVGTAERALIEGSVLIAIKLFLFLGELSSALVVIVALPLAMLI